MHLKYLFWQPLIILKLIGIYDMPLESGLHWLFWKSEDACLFTPKKKNKKSEIAKKKIWVAAILAGRSEHSKPTKF